MPHGRLRHLGLAQRVAVHGVGPVDHCGRMLLDDRNLPQPDLGSGLEPLPEGVKGR